MRDFRELMVWQKGHAITLEVYHATKGFPKEEIYGLTSQMRRASASIPMNIAEGCGRRGEAEFRQFIQISMGSASELEYQVQLAHDLNYLNDEKYNELTKHVIEINKMLTSLISKLSTER